MSIAAASAMTQRSQAAPHERQRRMSRYLLCALYYSRNTSSLGLIVKKVSNRYDETNIFSVLTFFLI